MQPQHQTKEKPHGRGLRLGACLSARRVHEWHQGLGAGHTQAQRQGFMAHCVKQPLQGVGSLRQAIYQARLVAAA